MLCIKSDASYSKNNVIFKLTDALLKQAKFYNVNKSHATHTAVSIFLKVIHMSMLDSKHAVYTFRCL